MARKRQKKNVEQEKVKCLLINQTPYVIGGSCKIIHRDLVGSSTRIHCAGVVEMRALSVDAPTV